MSISFTPTTIGLILLTIGVIALVSSSLRLANLEISFQTTKGRATLIFSLLHILVGLLFIVIDNLIIHQE